MFESLKSTALVEEDTCNGHIEIILLTDEWTCYFRPNYRGIYHCETAIQISTGKSFGTEPVKCSLESIVGVRTGQQPGGDSIIEDIR